LPRKSQPQHDEFPAHTGQGKWVPVTPTHALPEAFPYRVPLPDLPGAATLHMRVRGGVAVCERVEVDRNDGRSLTATDIRAIPFGRLIAEAPQKVIGRRNSAGDFAPLEPDELEQVRRAVSPKQGIPVDLADVAAVYRAALASGESPTAAVEDAFSLTPRTASRRVADARRAGHLGAALERRAGEKAGS
jgi:hypothetical protein